MSEFRDYKEVYIGHVNTVQNTQYKQSHDQIINNRVDSDKPLVLKTVDRSFSLKMIQARQRMNLTQSQLAKKICVKEIIIKEYESGNGKFDNKIVQKIKKTLNI